MSILQTMVIQIIKGQELIIGPIALNEARKVQGILITGDTNEIKLQKDDPKVVDRLVGQYEKLFGRASREVCREAVRDIIGELPAEKIPASLK